jgi:hypothetical protein
MTDDLKPQVPAPTNTTTDRTADQPWPGPLGNPDLTEEVRQRLAEDRVLAVEARLDPGDHSLPARHIRETAGSIRDHRDAAKRRHEWQARDPAATERGVADSPADGRLRVLLPRSIVYAVRREWQLLDKLPSTARAARIADMVWQRGYRASYQSAYSAAASRIAVASAEAAVANPSAWAALHQLAVAAGEPIARMTADQPEAPPIDRRTAAATRAVAEFSDQQPAWRRIAERTWVRSWTAGTVAGTVTATADILVGWRARGGDGMAEDVLVNGRPARRWIADLLAAVNRDITAPHAAVGSVGRTAAQLAREDHASGVSVTRGTAGGRSRQGASPSPAATTARRTR